MHLRPHALVFIAATVSWTGCATPPTTDDGPPSTPITDERESDGTSSSLAALATGPGRAPDHAAWTARVTPPVFDGERWMPTPTLTVHAWGDGMWFPAQETDPASEAMWAWDQLVAAAGRHGRGEWELSAAAHLFEDGEAMVVAHVDLPAGVDPLDTHRLEEDLVAWAGLDLAQRYHDDTFVTEVLGDGPLWLPDPSGPAVYGHLHHYPEHGAAIVILGPDQGNVDLMRDRVEFSHEAPPEDVRRATVSDETIVDLMAPVAASPAPVDSPALTVLRRIEASGRDVRMRFQLEGGGELTALLHGGDTVELTQIGGARTGATQVAPERLPAEMKAVFEGAPPRLVEVDLDAPTPGAGALEEVMGVVAALAAESGGGECEYLAPLPPNRRACNR